MQKLFESHADYNMIWLGDDQQFVARFDTAATPFQIAVLGLYTQPDSLTKPKILSALHDTLPLQGWHTLSIVLPRSTNTSTDQSTIPAEPTEEDTASAEKTVNDDTASKANTIDPRAIAHVKAALDFLQSQQVRSVALITDNAHIALALNTVVTHKGFVSGLILWQVDHKSVKTETLKTLKTSRVSILDISGDNQTKQQFTQRKQQFARADFTKDYKPLILSDTTPSSISVKRIRYWLENEFRKY